MKIILLHILLARFRTQEKQRSLHYYTNMAFKQQVQHLTNCALSLVYHLKKIFVLHFFLYYLYKCYIFLYMNFLGEVSLLYLHV